MMFVLDESRSLEQISRVTPFGVRFRDIVTGSFVGDGLNVSGYPPGDPAVAVQGITNRHGVYLLFALPGMHEVEFGAGDQAYWAGVPQTPFVIKVEDPEGRYQPFTLSVEMPLRDLFVWAQPLDASPPGQVPCVPLYPAPARAVAGPFGVLRAELFDTVNNVPAAWAMGELKMAGKEIGRGYADANGRLAIIFPYPEPPGISIGSPPSQSGVRFSDTTWTVQLSVRYTPQRVPPGFPDLVAVYGQVPAALFIDSSPPVSELDLTVEFSKELIVRSALRSELLIIPAGSPL